jgi:hypothetical protein
MEISGEILSHGRKTPERKSTSSPPTSVPISGDVEWSPGVVYMLCSRERSVAPAQNETMTPPLFTPLD